MSQKENLKIKRVMEKLKDERSKKVIFVAHCMLNENSRWFGGAFRRGCIDEIVDQIQDRGIGIVQMECPEQATGGVVKIWEWRMLGAKDTLLYRIERCCVAHIHVEREKSISENRKRSCKRH